MSKISPTVRERVRRRADGCCEYCGWADAFSEARFQMDHIRAQKHAGETDEQNLAYACGHCNRHKGPNLSGVDPDTKAVVQLYNPRTEGWATHFRFDGVVIVGLTAVGRATIAVLKLNASDQLLRRSAIADERL